MSGRYPHDTVWDYWATNTSEGIRLRWALANKVARPVEPVGHGEAVTSGPRNGLPETLPYRWRPSDQERDAWVVAMVALARRRARDRIAAEVREGRWWVPGGFTEADLDALLAKL